MLLPSILQYFRSCYQADLRAVHLINFLGKKVSFARLETDSAWISDTWRNHPVPTAWATDLQKHLLIHGKEQQLYACAFLLTGRAKVLGKIQEVCSPLYLIPASLTLRKDVFMVELDHSNTVINPAFAEILQQDQDLDNGLYQYLQQQLLTGSLGFDTQHVIETTFRSLALPVDLEGLFDFPMNIDLEDLKFQVQKQRNGFRLLPVLGLGVLDKQSGSLGVMNELEAMASGGLFSPVLHGLFETKTEKYRPPVRSPILLPVTLSVNQEAILQASASELITLVNGPPGTGKSFTIAAIAADRLSKGESVLIAAKNIQAVEVIADKLERDFQLPGIPIRATRKDYRQHLRKRLKDWLYGAGLISIGKGGLDRQKDRMNTLSRKIRQLTDQAVRQGQNEMRYGQLVLEGKSRWYQSIEQWFLKSRIKSRRPFWALMEELETLVSSSHQTGSDYLSALFHHRLEHALHHHHRHALQSLWEALKSRTGNEKASYFQDVDFSKVLHAMPIWLVNTGNVHQVLPLEAGLFDLVIVDEASQSDIASVLPVLQRAKRAVIVGDPNQLRHISFLSREQQNNFARQFGLVNFKPQSHLSFRDTSILDLTADRIVRQSQVYMLDEHFRSLPGIIAFSNRRFYDSRLKIMTATPKNRQETTVFIHQVEGKRNASGQNMMEAEAMVAAVSELVAAEADLEPRFCQSIGLLSPFRGQVDLLKRQLGEQFTAEQLERHRILIGSPYDFQGEERDVMFLSWTVDRETPTGVFLYLNREDVFNVSITRARVAQHLYTSIETSHLPANALLRDYLHAIGSNVNVSRDSAHKVDAFIEDIISFLETRGYHHYLVNYHIAGMEIDLVVLQDGKTYCIDFIGYPGPYQSPLPLERWRMLGRVGLRGFTLPYSLWLMDRPICEAALLNFLGNKPL